MTLPHRSFQKKNAFVKKIPCTDFISHPPHHFDRKRSAEDLLFIAMAKSRKQPGRAVVAQN
jgi:hypothetical protein